MFKRYVLALIVVLASIALVYQPVASQGRHCTDNTQENCYFQKNLIYIHC